MLFYSNLLYMNAQWAKKCHLGEPRYLPQRLKVNVFWIFFSFERELFWKSLRSEESVAISLWGNRANISPYTDFLLYYFHIFSLLWSARIFFFFFCHSNELFFWKEYSIFDSSCVFFLNHMVIFPKEKIVFFPDCRTIVPGWRWMMYGEQE